MAFEHKSGVPGVYDRQPSKTHHTEVLFRDGQFVEGADLNEAISISRERHKRVGNLVSRDGDRIEGCEAIVDVAAETVTLTPGRLYIDGDVRPILGATLTGVSMVGQVVIGVRVVTEYLDEEDDVDLAGIFPGEESEGEPTAAREVKSLAWGIDGDGNPGNLYAVYLLRDGTVIDQTPPPILSGVSQAIGVYDYDVNGNYIVYGCRVTALGKVGNDQQFSIEAGRANILGAKRTREASLLHVETEDPDLAQVDAESHTFDDGGTGTAEIDVNLAPISAVIQVIVDKQVTRTITKGVSGGIDALPDSSVFEIVSVTQGGTTYVATTDYVRNGDNIDWSPGGAEPTDGSSYDVEYRYRDIVAPDSFSNTTVTVSGGFTGGEVQLTYTFKMKRIDLLCLDVNGLSAYVKGVPARVSPVAPVAPESLAKLCEITNDWFTTPTVRNNGPRKQTQEDLQKLRDNLYDAYNLIGIERLRRELDSRELTAKKGVFVDPFVDNSKRDAGEPQTAATFEGSCQLPVAPTFYTITLDAPVTLDYTEETIVDQPLSTTCNLINPYDNFDPLPAELTITPSMDFWTERQTQFLSDVTQTFGTGQVVRTTTTVDVVDQREELLEFLRQIDIAFTIDGFGAGEQLDELLFDGRDVTPAGPLVADGVGVLSGTFTIPANVTAGTKPVKATGAGGTTAENVFTGQGILQIDVMRRTNLVTRQPIREPGGGGDGGADPLAQSYSSTEPRMQSSFEIKFCSIGDVSNGVRLQLVRTSNASEGAVFPTRDVMAEAFVNMSTVTENQWTKFSFPIPVPIYPNRQYAFVVMTDDPDHAISGARIGDFIEAEQRFVSAQPYTVGVMFSSSNAVSWNVHNDEDLTFKANAAVFSPTAKVVDLGTHSVVNCSDLMVRAAVELPTADARLWFEVERPNGEVYRLQPNQNLELTEFITEDIEVRAVLQGTSKISPILYRNILLVAGTMATSATYVSNAFKMGTNIRVGGYYKAYLPAGSTAAMEVDAANDTFVTVPLDITEPINGGWVEREHQLDPFTAQLGRIKLTLTGSPAARPSLADLRVAAI